MRHPCAKMLVSEKEKKLWKNKKCYASRSNPDYKQKSIGKISHGKNFKGDLREYIHLRKNNIKWPYLQNFAVSSYLHYKLIFMSIVKFLYDFFQNPNEASLRKNVGRRREMRVNYNKCFCWMMMKNKCGTPYPFII